MCNQSGDHKQSLARCQHIAFSGELKVSDLRFQSYSLLLSPTTFPSRTSNKVTSHHDRLFSMAHIIDAILYMLMHFIHYWLSLSLLFQQGKARSDSCPSLCTQCSVYFLADSRYSINIQGVDVRAKYHEYT